MSKCKTFEEFLELPVINNNPKEFLHTVITYMINGPRELNFWGYMTTFIPILIKEETFTARLVYSTEFSIPVVEISEEFIKRINLQELIFTIYHEYKHYIDLHPFRIQNRDRSIANIAQDREINSSLSTYIPNKYAYPIRSLDLYFRYPGWGPEMYEKIYEVEKELQKEGFAKDPNGGRLIKIDNVDGSLFDSHDWESFEETDEESEVYKIKRIIESCSEQAGTQPAGIDKYIKEFIKPKFNPIYLINSWANSLIKEDYDESYANINHACIDLPGCIYKFSPSILVVQDTSGSMNNTDFGRALGIVEYLLRENTLKYLPVDCNVPDPDEVKELTLNTVKTKGISVLGGGGTLMGPAIELANKLSDIDGVICLTDGELYENLDKISMSKPLLFMTTRESKRLLSSKWPVVQI